MARLVVNPGSPAAWEIQLKPGANFIGRGFANDFKIPDGSVSGSHCQIVVSDSSVAIKDLGSTNGTFVNRRPVKEAALESGQMIHLGGVEILYCSDATAAESVTSARPGPLWTAIPPVPRPTPLKATLLTAAADPAPALPPPPLPPPPALPATGPQKCKHHPRTLARYFCGQCQHSFCELCITSRMSGGTQSKLCRHCGSELVPIRVQIVQPRGEKGFFARLPDAFVYPFRGSGLLVLIVSTLVFAALEFISAGIFSILIKIVAFGYLFSYMQNIIHATANEEKEIPGLPDFDGLFGACFRLVGCILMSFGLAIAVACFAFFQEEPMAAFAIIPAMVFGCIYFPMALLAVAMKDSVMAANPLVVVSSIFKVPLEYLIATIVLAGVVGIRVLGALVIAAFALRTYTTRSISELLMALGLRAFWSFAAVYLLTVNMRVLGLLYVTKKDKLGWF